ncbi:sensor histidine kinase [Vagococcus sp.]|uniref:sensor histidine kinase n=1 Tax=Vagococcus sp. TaxID=1933889 RepID=UPI003F97F27D
MKKKFLKSYLKANLNIYLLYCLLFFTFLFTVYLYRQPLFILIDGFLFTFLILLVWTMIDFRKKYQQHQFLEWLKKQDGFYSDQLKKIPEAASPLAQDYAELFRLAVEEKEVLQQNLVEQNQQLLDYYGMWTHQIKTPLAALNLLVQAQENQRYAKQMKNEMFKMDDYLGMMLHYLKLNHLEEDLVLTKINVFQTVKQVIRKYASFFIQKDLKVTIVPFEREIVTDEKWFVFILEQVIFNSIKYTKKGGLTIDFKEEQLLISDTGIGILPQDLPRVFEKGYTGFNGREDKKATGLGLHMCEAIAQRLGMEMKISSTVNQGTTMSIKMKQIDYEND